MESKTNYTLVGIAVLLLTTGLLLSLIWLSVGFNRNYNIYAVYTRESVNGLSEDSMVKFNGVRVGKIHSIKLSKTDPQITEILLDVDKDVLITTSTRATLITQGLTGVTNFGLTAVSSSRVPLKKVGAEPYPVIIYKPSFFN